MHRIAGRSRVIVGSGLVGLLLLAVAGCGGGGGGSSSGQTLTGTATFPQSVGGGPVANSAFIVVDLGNPNAALPGGTSDASGNWSVPGASGTNIAVIFPPAANSKGVRVSGLARPDQTGFGKDLNGQTDIACEAGLTGVRSGGINSNAIDGNSIAALEAAAVPFIPTTDFTKAASVSASAAAVRRLVFGF